MRQIDGKYKTSGDITKQDGTPVPEDEPLILFRAKDKLLPELLGHYLEQCRAAGSPEQHLSTLQQRIDAIKQWQAANPDRVKIPD